MDYEEQVPARWPNANFSDFTVLDQSNHWAHGTIGNGGSYSNGGLEDAGGTTGASNNLTSSGIDPVGAIAILNVGSFRTYSRTVTDFDSTNSTFYYDAVPSWKTKHHHYFLEGKRDLIDVEGEWWINSSNDRLHMLFPNGTNPNNVDVRVKTQSYAFNITNSNNISLQGLEFFATTFRSYQCDGCSVIDSDLMYPSTSKRGLGIAGEDVIKEFDYSEIYAPLELNIGHCRLSVAALKTLLKKEDPETWSNIRVATKYPNISKEYFASKGIQVESIKLNGSMELAPSLNMCRRIVDLVSTGTTLKANGLKEIDEIMTVSYTHLRAHET